MILLSLSQPRWNLKKLADGRSILILLSILCFSTTYTSSISISSDRSPLMTVPRIKVVTNADQLAEEAAKIVAEAADRAIRDKDVFSLVLSGGSTPRLLYSRLMREPYLMRLSWPKVQIYFGDERCVPP